MTSLVSATVHPSLDEGFRFCRDEVRRTARHFSYGFRMLPIGRRRAIESLYAFARHVDDIADEPGPDQMERLALLKQASEELDDQVFGDTRPYTPLFAALKHTVQAYALEQEPFHHLIEGMAWDAEGRQYKTLEEMEAYCYRAASTVGILSLPVFGVADRQAAKEPGISLGLFMQTVNILRDVGEDLNRDRVYLPSDLLAGFELTTEDLKVLQQNPDDAKRRPRFAALGRELGRRAHVHLEHGKELSPMLEPMGRMCVRVMSGLYEDILELMEKRQFEVFGKRPKLTRGQKWLRLMQVCLDPRST